MLHKFIVFGWNDFGGDLTSPPGLNKWHTLVVEGYTEGYTSSWYILVDGVPIMEEKKNIGYWAEQWSTWTIFQDNEWPVAGSSTSGYVTNIIFSKGIKY